ncbi:hypothetical protein A2533_03835 [Candidatus Falkowbacteria bacterium RIFOXYD2_FULL_35_9]|uniref:Uncharacterized protein n=1 Tax=Candidatus Falkowbacteria bacterium RIFOXYC2_FULL_36_12 TaxID=1798002 RepID=A0A1F5SX98_9BACT|nr:MAG: hypothetical protein A2300_00650 [Candidatus Falkowbacteria bacterium RIFOXYB2_FULL_35_7]OGF30851.1 MAG: hypothetical protein A2478_00145 [Candidatus Falkowbacteria bacterium RIFOXYC2_FULL_36_12]OGF33933.1 MAG: hypothetical protein A2223_04500 [Candidatus Falkowbacteria bacterium RIFOXYA2_FULL_35_8]OGF45981.1 MAG: hypothetical protein A2533_03835 [Candidatus Falkowbacteria bacterium RIFOXYD2_FULL_35_9]
MDQTINDKINALPEEVKKYFLSQTGVNFSVEIADKYFLTLSQMQEATKVLTEVFLKQIPLDNLQSEISKRLNMDQIEAKEFLIDLLGLRLLIVDDYFEGKVSEILKTLGIDSAVYSKNIRSYEDELANEAKATSENVEDEESVKKVDIDITDRAQELEIGKPEDEIKEMVQILRERALEVLTTDQLLMRIDFNIIITTLLLTDQAYQPQLINALFANKQKITEKPIEQKGEMIEPTIGNWLKNFSTEIKVAESDRITTMQKAEYYNNNKNINALGEDERAVIDRVFDLYENLKNFYYNSKRLKLDEIQIFPFTEKEQQDFIAKYEPKDENGTTEGGVVKKTKNLEEMYLGNESERQALEQATEKIVEQTRKEYDKLVNYFYDRILERNKVEILACLQLVIEAGLIDDILIREKTFQELMQSYFKRNNLKAEAKEFEMDKSDPKFLKYFIKYILLERLGLGESQSARVAVHFSNIFRNQGKMDLSHLAYFDVENKVFKWL